MNKELKELQEQNQILRDEISVILSMEFDDKGIEVIMGKINDLIENELSQEKYCGE